jgi:predicted signal transduction protein with EAL and GGDEF domain
VTGSSGGVVGRLETELASSEGARPVVGLVALDRLDELRELVGHEATDLVVEEFNSRLKTFARRRDSLVSIDPDRVLVVLRGLASPEHLALAGAKIERVFAEPVEVFDQQVKISVHGGFVMPASGRARDVLRRAESALRKARSEHRAWAIWNEREPPGAGLDLALERRIDEGISAGEFVLYHQPKVHANYGTLVGAEVLMRWHHPQRGVVQPADFIATAERTGAIRELTHFAVKAALVECARWPVDLGVAVNLAPALLGDDEIVRVVCDALALFAVEPRRLTLEITESGLARDRDRAFSILSDLRRTGVRISIDDFGTGYSSFSHFRDIPADELKIDRSFVAHMRERDADQRIVKSIIDIGHNFAMKVVAEGVEEDDDATLLKRLGCDYLQGYSIAKPMPARDFRAWVDRRLGTATAAG